MEHTHTNVDVAIVGAGIAGASLAYFAAPHARVLLLEREAQPGLHSTGRSAAMFMESYGSPQVRALTRASRPFFEQPPAGFCSTPLMAPRGALYIARAEQRGELQALYDTLRQDGCPARWLEGAAARALVPVLLAQACDAAVLDPLATDLDVHALHQGYLRGARTQGAQLRCGAEVLALQACAGGSAHGHADGAADDNADGPKGGPEDGDAGWLLHTRTGTVHARRVVNAAGAWADELAALAGVAPIGLQPRRRSAFVFEGPAGVDSSPWPCVATVDESVYFKPEAGLLLGSPANADPVPAHDVMPEELDIATGIARIEAATTMRIRRPRRTWAGLRSFVADGDLVGGFEPGPENPAPGFFWLAAQGGYGIQTSAAMGACCAALLLGLPQPAWAAAALPVLQTLAPRRGT
jgi:D-arginine dehydrogenase